MKNNTHYRNVFKSDHLGVADLEDFIESGHNLIFTVQEVRQEYGATVAGRKGDFNIAYFNEDIKPMVLNATNSEIMRGFCGGNPHIAKWDKDIKIQLYIDPTVKMKGEIVGGIKININKPKGRQELKPEMKDRWSGAIAACKRDGNLDKVLERIDVSEANQKLIMEAANVS